MARAGHGVEAWKVVCTSEIVAILLGIDSFQNLLRWLKGITYRALGQLDSAIRELSTAREVFLTAGDPFRAALVSMDLASVLASRGHLKEIKPIAEEAYRTFRAEGLEDPALAAFLIFYKAVQAEELSAGLALRVANYLVLFQQNRALRFDLEEE